MRNRLLLPSMLLFGMLIGTLGTAHAQGTADVKITRIRVIPLKMPSGVLRQEVLIDWKNVGRKPIYSVKADVLPVATGGKAMRNGLRDSLIFVAGDNGNRPVMPGQSFTDQPGSGVRLKLSYVPARIALAKITRIETSRAAGTTVNMASAVLTRGR